MESPKDKYVPVWEGIIYNWTMKYIRNNLWRVQPHHDPDDLCQEGYLIFLKIKYKYPDIQEAQHFLSLYQRSFTNKIHDFSKSKTGEANFKRDNTYRMAEREKEPPRPFIDPDLDAYAVMSSTFAIASKVQMLLERRRYWLSVFHPSAQPNTSQ